MSRIIFQIGSARMRKQSQSIKAYINELEVSWNDNSGRFLTTHKDRVLKNTVWYMYAIDLQTEDILKLEVKTFLTGVGLDGERTFEAFYYADPEAPVRSIEMVGVGLKGYPVLKGKILEIGSVSEEDKRQAEIEDFINKDFE
jgi:hypothetical protein